MMSVVAKNYAACAAGEPVRLFKSHNPAFEDGGQLRDFVYVRDCVEVVGFLLDNPQANGVFNLGTGEARAFKDLIGTLYDACGQSRRIDYIDMPETLRAKYQYYTRAEMGRLQRGRIQPPVHLHRGRGEATT